MTTMWQQGPPSPQEEPGDYTVRRRQLERLRVAGWVWIGSGVALFINELGLWWAYLGLLALLASLAAGVYLAVRAWRPFPRLWSLGFVPAVAVALFSLGDPVTRLMATWVLLGLGLVVLARTR